MKDFEVPKWAQEGRHALLPCWQEIARLKESFEKVRGLSDDLEETYRELWRKVESKTATSSSSSSSSKGDEHKGANKKERERLRTRAKSVITSLENVEKSLEEKQTEFESSCVREVNCLMKRVAEKVLDSSRKDKSELNESIGRYKRFWIAQLSVLRYNKFSKTDLKNQSLKSYPSKAGKELESEPEVERNGKKHQEGTEASELDKLKAELLGCQKQLKKAQTKNKSLNESVAQLSLEKKDKVDEVYRLKLQMQGMVDGLKKKAEEISILKKKLEGSGSRDSSCSDNKQAQVGAFPVWKAGAASATSVSKDIDKKIFPTYSQSEGEAKEIDQSAEDTGREILMVLVPNLRTVSMIPFTTVNAVHDNQESLEISTTQGKDRRTVYVMEQNINLLDSLKKQAFSLPSWEERLGDYRKKQNEMSLLNTLAKETKLLAGNIAKNSNVSGEFLYKYSKLKQGLKKATSELDARSKNQKSWSRHIEVQRQRIKNSLVKIGQPEQFFGWIENQEAVKKFVKGSPEECSDSILAIVRCYEDWLLRFMSIMTPYMNETDRRLKEFLDSMAREKMALQEHVHQTHSGLMNIGNLVSAARALLSRNFELEQNDMNKSSDKQFLSDCQKYRQQLAEIEDERADILQAFTQYCDLSTELSLLQEKKIKLSARIQMIQLQTSDENVTEKVRKLSEKLNAKISETIGTQLKVRSYLEDCGVAPDALLGAMNAFSAEDEASENDPLISERKLADYDAVTNFSRKSDDLFYGRTRGSGKGVLLHKLKLPDKVEKSKVFNFLMKLKGMIHPSLLPTECAWLEDDCLYLQKLYLPDLVSFQEHFSRYRDLMDLCDKFRQLLQCLAFLHRNKFSLSPTSHAAAMSTVFVDCSGNVKIAECDIDISVESSTLEHQSGSGSGENHSFIAMSMSATADEPRRKRLERKGSENEKLLANLKLFGEMLYSCAFPNSRLPCEELTIPHHENAQLRDLLGQLLRIGPALPDDSRIQSADEALAHPFFSVHDDSHVSQKVWKFSLLDEKRLQLQSGSRLPVQMKISHTTFVQSVVKAFDSLDKEQILHHPLKFVYKSFEREALTNTEAINHFFREILNAKYGVFESFCGNVLPLPECRDIAVFGTIGKILAKCVLDKVKIPKNYFNSSLYKFLQGEACNLADLDAFHPVYAQHLKQVFLRRDEAKLEELAVATNTSKAVWIANPVVLFQAVLSKMLVGSRSRQLTALKDAFFSSVELRGHLKIFSSQELQELLEQE